MNIEFEIKKMENKMEELDGKLERLDEKVDEKFDSLHNTISKTSNNVEKILTIVVGNEYNSKDSLLAKISKLESEVEILKNDKIRRDAKTSLLMLIAGVLGAVGGSLLSAYIQTIFNTKK